MGEKILQKKFPCALQDCTFVGFSKKVPYNSKLSVTDPVVKILFCSETKRPQVNAQKKAINKCCFHSEGLKIFFL